jgi:hypothetical protein
MALGATKISAVFTHVDVHLPRRLEKRQVKIAVFHTLTTAPKEVAGTACLPGRGAHVSRNFSEVGWLPNLARAFWPFLGLIDGMSCASRVFLVRAGGVMADQAVHVSLDGEVKRVIPPTVSGMTAGASWLIRPKCDTEVVNHMLTLADDSTLLSRELFFGSRANPRPMAGLHDLFCSLSVTG